MKNTRLPLIYMVCLLFAGLLMAAIPAKSPGYQIGDSARDFKLKNVDGKMVSMSDYADAQGFIVTFTCNSCPYSVAYEDRLIALHKKYAPKGYPVIAINPNDASLSPEDSYANMQRRAKEKKFPFPYLYDQTQEITRTYGATRTPHLYILKKGDNGEYKVAYIGTIDDNSRDPQQVQKRYAEAALNDMIAGDKVKEPSTKAIGCTIKWKKA